MNRAIASGSVGEKCMKSAEMKSLNGEAEEGRSALNIDAAVYA